MSALPACVYVPHVCALCMQVPEWVVGSPGPKVTGNWKPPCWN